MKIILQVFRDILILVVLAFLALALFDVHRSLQNTAGQARYTLDNANRLIRELAQTSANARHATAEWEAASQQQAAYFTQAAAKTDADLDALGSTIAQAGSTIATANQVLKDQNAAALAVELQAQRTLAALETQTNQLAPILAHVDQLAGNPDLADMLHQLDATTADAQKAMASLDSIAASGDRDAQMLEARLREALKPATLAKTVFERLLGIAGPAAQIATAIK